MQPLSDKSQKATSEGQHLNGNSQRAIQGISNNPKASKGYQTKGKPKGQLPKGNIQRAVAKRQQPKDNSQRVTAKGQHSKINC